MLDQAIEHARQMNQLIDDLLRLSRVGRQPLSSKPVVMVELAHQTLEELREIDPERVVEVLIADLPDCQGDAGLLRQELINLLSNAIKLTCPGEKARIEFGYQRERGTIVYLVRDNGVGFEMKYADQLFGVFPRLHRQDDF
jgi:light-regulated signal transduction histidine kinase (bacteriophytochrome)